MKNEGAESSLAAGCSRASRGPSAISFRLCPGNFSPRSQRRKPRGVCGESAFTSRPQLLGRPDPASCACVVRVAFSEGRDRWSRSVLVSGTRTLPTGRDEKEPTQNAASSLFFIFIARHTPSGYILDCFFKCHYTQT